MTDALSILNACRDNPGDFTVYLIAADFFADSDEGDFLELECALRWMAANGKHPQEVASKLATEDVSSVIARHWIWYPDAPLSSYGAPNHAKLPRYLLHHPRRYYAWVAALFDLAHMLATSAPIDVIATAKPNHSP